ncbi:hypothetical protein FB451DRAFT_1375343 [Mycena latifolia]|nr:hypothetical protein FB451DRAFT_1375343 [Mycena latifolia]
MLLSFLLFLSLTLSWVLPVACVADPDMSTCGKQCQSCSTPNLCVSCKGRCGKCLHLGGGGPINNKCVECLTNVDCLAIDPTRPNCVDGIYLGLSGYTNLCIGCNQSSDCIGKVDATQFYCAFKGTPDAICKAGCGDDGDCCGDPNRRFCSNTDPNKPGECAAVSPNPRCTKDSDCTTASLPTCYNPGTFTGTCVASCSTNADCTADPGKPTCYHPANGSGSYCDKIMCATNRDCQSLGGDPILLRPTWPYCQNPNTPSANCVRCLDDQSCPGNYMGYKCIDYQYMNSTGRTCIPPGDDALGCTSTPGSSCDISVGGTSCCKSTGLSCGFPPKCKYYPFAPPPTPPPFTCN